MSWPSARSFRTRMINSTVPSSSPRGEVFGRRDRGSNAASPSARYRADQPTDPALRRDAVLSGDVALGAALDNNSGDDKA